MATITTLKVQVPQASSPLLEIQQDERGMITGMSVSVPWQQFFHIVQMITFYESASGPTASRPNSSSSSDKTRWIGQKYFDTDLGLPVFLKTASTNVWVKADGTVA